jgi:hypothetical protein
MRICVFVSMSELPKFRTWQLRRACSINSVGLSSPGSCSHISTFASFKIVQTFAAYQLPGLMRCPACQSAQHEVLIIGALACGSTRIVCRAKFYLIVLLIVAKLQFAPTRLRNLHSMTGIAEDRYASLVHTQRNTSKREMTKMNRHVEQLHAPPQAPPSQTSETSAACRMECVPCCGAGTSVWASHCESIYLHYFKECITVLPDHIFLRRGDELALVLVRVIARAP